MNAMATEMPERIAGLPRDDKGRPVPFFVQWTGGKPDFRIMDPERMVACIREKLCWVCGQKMGVWKAFVIGPMCGINRTSAEPPSHLECAEFSVRACPFLSTPKMTRREHDLPVVKSSGIMIRRNPGVMAIWITKGWRVFPDGAGGILFELGEPSVIKWYCEGRKATRAEIEHSIETGIPVLRDTAREDGQEESFNAYVANFRKLLPAT